MVLILLLIYGISNVFIYFFHYKFQLSKTEIQKLFTMVLYRWFETLFLVFLHDLVKFNIKMNLN